MSKISVIIPIYNVEQYLEECLTSVLAQTYKNLEIILVNDGSKDNSLKIAQEFSKKDDRIKLISQENQGLSMARNAGIKEASGDFISFIDSDDWISPNYYEKLINSIEKNSCDIALASILRVRENSKKDRIKYEKEEIKTSLADKIKLCDIPRCCYVWNKLYKKELIENSPFTKGAYYEDVLWTPEIIKKAQKIVSVPDCYYYYRANASSIVKQKQNSKKQKDSYIAKKKLLKFFKENNLNLSKKQKTITKSIKYLFNLPILKEKEYQNTITTLLFGFLPIYFEKIKTPVIKENTFLVWEPCSVSHSEVVPGYVKYLLDLGYHVSVLVTPERYKEGLFSRFQENENLTLNKLNQKEIRRFFKEGDLSSLKGILTTTAGKICDCVNYNLAYDFFNPTIDKSKLFFVEHEASFAIDKNSWNEKLITLRKLDYKGAKSVVVNPHYFGEVKITPKNDKITNFITIGAIRPNKKNSQLIIEAAKKLVEKGYNNFKITVVGKGHLKGVSKDIAKFFDIKGRLDFKNMYNEIEKADFMLTAYDDKDKEHIRYNTSGTSGNFQLVYGFLKPCIIIKSFCDMNGFTEKNSISYDKVENYYKALEKGISLSKEDYSELQKNLKEYKDEFYMQSLNNLKGLING